MHWTDNYKTEGELRDVLKRGRVGQDGVVPDGGRVRTAITAMDIMFPAERRGDGPGWLDADQPQYLKDTAGMSLYDVASAVANHPIRGDLSASEMRRDAVSIRMGDAWTAGKSDDVIEAAFVALVASCRSDIARAKRARAATEAWRAGA